MPYRRVEERKKARYGCHPPRSRPCIEYRDTPTRMARDGRLLPNYCLAGHGPMMRLDRDELHTKTIG